MAMVANSTTNLRLFLPLELVGTCTGSRTHSVMKREKDINGTLLGSDDLVKMVLKDVRV
jgi:U6 snRNA-associated Sm-like protein LSm5